MKSGFDRFVASGLYAATDGAPELLKPHGERLHDLGPTKEHELRRIARLGRVERALSGLDQARDTSQEEESP